MTAPRAVPALQQPLLYEREFLLKIFLIGRGDCD